MSNHDLKIGTTAIIQYEGFKKAVTVTSFDETSGLVNYQTKNVGDKAITKGGTIWVEDWGGVIHSQPYGWWAFDDFYPGESRSGSINIYKFEDMGRAGVGKLTIHFGLGDKEASWIIRAK